MQTNKLYIIGNGFDLHHGIKSSYWDFKEYLEHNDADLVEKLEEYFGTDALWSDFEETLAYLDTEQITDECMSYLVSYGVDDWSDAYHHDYQYEVQRRIDLITENLKQRFTDWILELQLPENAEQSKVHLDNKALFINFNYTGTLERLYNVPSNKIFYIHNKAVDVSSTLILGHGRNPQNEKTLVEIHNDEDIDVRVAEGNKILDDYFVETYKSTKTIIHENKPFFDSLEMVKVIYVYGHSLSVVDKPYFQEIVKRIDKVNVFWKVSFHNNKDLIGFNNFFNNLKIPTENIVYDRINNIDSKQLSLFTNDKL